MADIQSEADFAKYAGKLKRKFVLIAPLLEVKPPFDALEHRLTDAELSDMTKQPDPLDYSTRTHHTNMDVYDRVQPADMMRNAVIVVSCVYHTANREQLLPRKPMPTPQKTVRP